MKIVYALVDNGADASVPDRSGVLAAELATEKVENLGLFRAWHN